MMDFEQFLREANTKPDYNTNAGSYYKDLARKQQLIELLAKKIWEYEDLLDESLENLSLRLEKYINENDSLMSERLKNWDERIENLDDEVSHIFIEWLEDGTLEQIINHDVLGNKADKADLDKVTKHLEQIAINVKYPPYLFESAKGDGVTDDTQAIQSLLDYAYSNGGGEIFIPEGHYIISKALRVKDNVKLVGKGYQSWIENITVEGFERCVVITGNIGDITSKTSVYDEIQYNIDDISFGDYQVSLDNVIDANNFNVGDLVFILSEEKWSTTFPDSMVAKYQNINKITKKENGVLTLKHPIPDNYINPTICKLDGNILGYDKETAWMAENVLVSNLRLTHKIGQSSGWYAVFAYGFECEFSKLTMDNVSTMFGSNALGYSVIKDIVGSFDAGFMDFADLQISNLYENIKAKRIGLNTLVNVLGFSCHDGSDNTLRNCTVDFGNAGNISGLYQHRFKIEGGKYTNISTEHVKASISGCYGDGFECIGVTLEGGKYHGILVLGNQAKCLNNNIKKINYTPTFYGVTLSNTSKECIVEGNMIGEEGSKTPQDTVIQTPTFNPSNIIRNNGVHGKQDNYVNKNYAETSSLTDYVLKEYKIKQSSFKKATTYKVVASGTRSGVGGNKSVKLKLGNIVIAQVDYTNTDTQRWYIEATIAHGDLDSSPRCHGKGMKNLELVYQNIQQINDGLANDTQLTLEGSVSNSSDKLNIDLFLVNIND